jgi:hypothetical protein
MVKISFCLVTFIVILDFFNEYILIMTKPDNFVCSLEKNLK